MYRTQLRKTLFFVLTLISACSKPAPQEQSMPVEADRNNPSAAVYNIQLGIGYLREGNVSRAKSKLLLAKEQDPSSPEVWAALAYFYESTGNTAQADTYYLKAINLDPKRGSSLNNYGVFLCKNGDYKKSINYFVQAVNDPNYLNDAATYENAGLCAEQGHDNVNAEKFFTVALQNNPTLPTSTLELAEINFNNGKFDLASKYLQRYNQIAKPSSESIWLDLQLGRQAKDAARVKADAVQLKENFPDSDEYKQAKLSGLE